MKRRGFLKLLLGTAVAASVKWLTRQEIIASLLRTKEGRAKLAESMAQPLRKRMDYESIGRRMLSIQPLPEGAHRER